MSAAERLDHWIEEAATIREMLAALPGCEPVVPLIAAREQALREAAALFAAETEELAEEPEPAGDQVAFMPFEDPAPEEASPPPAASRVAPSAPAPESGQPSPAGRAPTVWTPERDALALRLHGEGKPAAEIWQACNALPGPAIASSNSTQVRIYKLRSRGAPEPAAEPEPETTQPATPLPPAIHAAPRSTPDDEPLERARELLRQRVPHHRIMSSTGISADTLTALVIEEATLVDNKIAERQAKAKQALRDGEPDWQVAQRYGLKQGEIIRLKAEIREEARSAAA